MVIINFINSYCETIIRMELEIEVQRTSIEDLFRNRSEYMGGRCAIVNRYTSPSPGVEILSVGETRLIEPHYEGGLKINLVFQSYKISYTEIEIIGPKDPLLMDENGIIYYKSPMLRREGKSIVLAPMGVCMRIGLLNEVETIRERAPSLF